jgi:dephospho-CoA kinase
VVINETKHRFGEVTEANEKIVREELRAQDGMAAIAKRVIPEIDELTQINNVVIADGLYSWAEYKLFKERWGDNAIIIAVTAPRKLRHNRLATRPIRPLTDTEVSSREYAEIENLEKGGPIANADYTIVNQTTAEDMFADLAKILTENNIAI